MSRFTSTAMQAQSSLSLVSFRLLIDVGVTSSTLYCCTGNQFIFALGNTYSPVGGLGTIEGIEEESDSFPRAVVMRLAAVSSEDLFEPMRESMFNRPVNIYRTFLRPNDMTQVDTPEKLWAGRVSQVTINLDLEDPYYEVRAETILRRTAKVQYFNKETLQAIDSSDTFANHVERIPLFKGMWGQQATYFPSIANDYFLQYSPNGYQGGQYSNYTLGG